MTGRRGTLMGWAEMGKRLRGVVLFGFAMGVASLAVADPVLPGNPPTCSGGPEGTGGSCSTCPSGETVSNACVFVTIPLGKVAPWSSLRPFEFRIKEDRPVSSLYSPAGLKLVSTWTLRLVSPEQTAGGVPKVVTALDGAGLPVEFTFNDNEYVAAATTGMEQDLAARLYMVDAEGWTTTREPAYYDLYPGDGTRFRFMASAAAANRLQLVSLRHASGREDSMVGAGVEIIRDEEDLVRQVRSPGQLADVVIVDENRYDIRIYDAAAVTGQKDAQGCYRLAPDAQPLAEWRIINPVPGTMERFDILKLSGSYTNAWRFSYSGETEGWTMKEGADGVLRQNVREYAFSDGRLQADEVYCILGPDGKAVSKSLRRFSRLPWGYRITKRVNDPDGVALTEWFNYTFDGRLSAALKADGSWSEYEYINNAVSVKTSPWKDIRMVAYEYNVKIATSASGGASPTPLAVTIYRQPAILMVTGKTGCVATYMDYTPVDGADLLQPNDLRPRTETEKILGQVVGRTFHAYVTNASGEYAEITERAASTNAGYGAAGNARDIWTYYGRETAGHQVGRLKSVQYADGRLDSYSYEYGIVSSNVFTADPNGNAWRVLVLHGSLAAPSGLSGRSLRTTQVYDYRSRQVLSETWVLTGVDGGQPVYRRVEWVAREFDALDHMIVERRSDGRQSDSVWGSNCCGKQSETDVDGVQTVYGYDLLGRRVSASRLGASPADPVRISTYTLDVLGRRLGEVVNADSLVQTVVSNVYDGASRLVSSTDGAGITTRYLYEEGGRITTTLRRGLTNVVERYIDGRIKTVTENGALKTAYDYGVNSDGTRWTKVFTGPGGFSSPMWVKTTTDMLGHTVKEEKPGFGGAVVVNSYSYNALGQLTRSVVSSPSSTLATLYEYDELGQQIRSALDVNTNGVLDLTGPDRISGTAMWYEQDASNDFWHCRASLIYTGENSAVPTTNSLQRTRLTGLGASSGLGIQASDLVSLDLLGNHTTSRTYVDRTAKTVTQIVTYPDSSNSAEQVTVNGLLASSVSKTGFRTDYKYDGLGRQTSTLQGGSNALRTVGTFTYYNDKGQVDWIMDAASNVTTFAYDDLGRRITVTDALSNSTHTAYDDEGRVLATWGATYPVAYDYDAFGRMTAMYTYRGSETISSYASINTLKSSMDQTRWLYEAATGLLTNKLYADGRGPTYTYTPDGKLASRTWARGIVTAYNYDSLGQLTNISYSDNTPAVAFAFDRLGRQTTITDGAGTRAFTYNDALQLSAELVVAAVPSGASNQIAYVYDQFGRPAGFDSGPNYSVRYSFDALGRFSVISNNVGGALRAATYSYLPGSDLVAGYTTDTGFSLMRTYEHNRNLITSITNSFGNVPLHRFDYVNDQGGRRVQRADVDISAVISNLFAYNIRSELSEALMGTNSHSYRYDPIGNRMVATNSTAGGTETWSYAANALNQYLQLTNNQSFITPAYDLDGNMTSYKDWTFTWDAENRLILASNATTVVSNICDYMSRRVAKAVNGQATVFKYQGWAMFEESTSSATNSYVYGLDLSGTAQGAGTIGGILSAHFVSSNVSHLTFYSYDAIGNVTDLVSTNGTFLAQYQYDPYGNSIAKSGELASTNPFRFSTKYLDSETGQYYYGYRFYNTSIGRWASRDPIGEWTVLRKLRRGVTRKQWLMLTWLSRCPAYYFTYNRPAEHYDPDGMYGNPVSGPDGPVGPSDPTQPGGAFDPPTDWYNRLPDCPCSIPLDKAGCPVKGQGGDVWTDPGPTGHYGGTWETRTVTRVAWGSGQQCVYDSEGNLINLGPAGTPDAVGPSGPGGSVFGHILLDGWEWVFGTGFDHATHPPNPGRGADGKPCPPNDGSAHPPRKNACCK